MKLLQLAPSPNGQVCSKWWPCHFLWSALSFPCIQMSPMEFARCFTDQFCCGETTFNTNPCHDTSALYIMWSRNGGFDNKPRFPFRPNHFVPLSREISYFHSLDAFPASRSSSPVLVSSSDHQQSSCPASSGNSLWSHTSPFHLRK